MLLAILMGQLYLLMVGAQSGSYKEIKMIISHKQKFIFVKMAKGVGTLSELALCEHLGEVYISTPVVAYDEKKAQENGYPLPRT